MAGEYVVVAPTRMGLVQPNSFMDAATCATCSGVCVRGFVMRGISRLMGHRSTWMLIRISMPQLAFFRLP